MSSTRIRRSEPCTYENCGSRRFHIGDDGYTYCDQGHQQSDRGTVIAEDTGELVVHGPKSRRRDSDAASATSRTSSYSGPRAFEHYLLCAQLVLRKQLRWLIEVQRLPEELEVLVRDLWTLRLQRLQTRTPAGYTSGSDTEAQSSQFFSSQTESGSGSESRTSRRKGRTAREARREAPSLVDALAICYVGVLLLRIPLTVVDFTKWVNDGDLLYYRARREVPSGMRQRLPGEYERQLEPLDLLRGEALHQKVLETITLLHDEFGMAVPPINTSLVLHRWMTELALPVEIFIATQRLARMVGMDCTYDGQDMRVVLRYPEARLMALVVVSTKLLFPMDGFHRRPPSTTGLSAVSVDWKEWVKMHEAKDGERRGEGKLTFEQAFSIGEAECLNADNETLDAYMDWYDDNIASEEVRERGAAGKDAEFRRALFSLFPQEPRARPSGDGPPSLQPNDKGKRPHSVEETLPSNNAVQGATQELEVRELGSFYRRYRSVEELSGPAKVFFDKAARLAGVSVDAMVQAVFVVERKLQKQEESARKRGGSKGE